MDNKRFGSIELNDEFDIFLLLKIIRSRFLFISIICLLCGVGAFLYLRYSDVIFEAKAVLQVKSDNTAGKVLNLESTQGNVDELEENVELIKSKTFLKRVIAKLPLDISYYNKGVFKVFETYQSAPYIVEVKNKTRNITNKQLFIRFNDTKTFTLYNITKTLKLTQQPNVWFKLEDAEVRITLVNPATALGLKEEMYFTINDENTLINYYLSKLSVSILNPAAKTIVISFKDFTALKTSDIANAVVNEFNSFDIERKSASSQKILSFIDGQLANVYADLRKSEGDLETFQRDNKLSSNPKEVSSNYATRLNDLDEDITKIKLEKSVLTEFQSALTQNKDADVYKLLPMLAGTQYEGSMSLLISNLQELLMRREKALYDINTHSSNIKNIDYQIDIQKKLIIESIANIRNKIASKENSMNQKIAEFEGKFLAIPTKEIEYARLERLFNINEKFYTLLLEKKAEYSISNAGFVSNNTILEEAIEPHAPVSPNRGLAYATAIALAVLLSLINVVFSYLMHNEIITLNDISRNTNTSILGIVPNYDEPMAHSQLIIDKSPKSLISEAFRSIRTNMQYIAQGGESKLMAVTSTISGEGKTFVSVNLGGIIAFSGRRVVICDLDMRKPKIHHAFGTDNKVGMSQLLIGATTLEECVQHSSIKGYDYITAGTIPPNPSELILSKKMEEIIELLKSKYDLVIFDNPPIGIVSDGLHIIKKVDFPVYVFRSNYSKKQFITNLNVVREDHDLKNLSIVLNGVSRQTNSYGYGQNYGYGYGYGYGGGYYEDGQSKKKENSNWWKKIFPKT